MCAICAVVCMCHSKKKHHIIISFFLSLPLIMCFSRLLHSFIFYNFLFLIFTLHFFIFSISFYLISNCECSSFISIIYFSIFLPLYYLHLHPSHCHHQLLLVCCRIKVFPNPLHLSLSNVIVLSFILVNTTIFSPPDCPGCSLSSFQYTLRTALSFLPTCR